jgi:hypothetical protein
MRCCAADIRQDPVDDEEIETSRLERLDAGFPVRKHFDLMPLALQQRLEHFSLASTVLNHRKYHKTSRSATNSAPFMRLRQSFIDHVLPMEHTGLRSLTIASERCRPDL